MLFVGRGVFYGAATTEAQAMRGEEVFIVGGANSAGQAATYLARFATQVTLLVRGSSLGKGMSGYLVREIEASPNITVRLNTEVAAARGDHRLRSLVLRDRAGSAEEVTAAALFVLIGAVPRTAWLPDDVKRNGRGFVLTGPGLAGAPDEAPISPFGTSLPGVFAVGDVRAESVKRVASAVSEGSVPESGNSPMAPGPPVPPHGRGLPAALGIQLPYPARMYLNGDHQSLGIRQMHRWRPYASPDSRMRFPGHPASVRDDAGGPPVNERSKSRALALSRRTARARTRHRR